jgi:putrescine aminotransferase
MKNSKEIINETIKNYQLFHNPSLARLYKFAGYNSIEWTDEGIYIKDIDGKAYIDCAGGYGVFSLGHRHPEVIQAVKEQLDKMAMSSKLFFSKPLGDLCRLLSEITPGDLTCSFLCNSGAEAVEGALKLARLATGKSQIISAINAFHGMSVSGKTGYRKEDKPLVYIPFDDIKALEEAINENTAALILEPIQGEGGIIVPHDDYWPSIRNICTEKNILLIADEVQTGLGRTGKMFAVDHYGVVPDIMTMAKALGGGVIPTGAFIAKPYVWNCFKSDPLIHTSTFGGSPLACVAGIKTIEILKRDRLPEKAEKMGTYLLNKLAALKDVYPEIIYSVRGKGLLIGVELTKEGIGGALIPALVKRGVTAGYTLNMPKVIRFEPPLIITEEQIDKVIVIFEEAIKEAKKTLSIG